MPYTTNIIQAPQQQNHSDNDIDNDFDDLWNPWDLAYAPEDQADDAKHDEYCE